MTGAAAKKRIESLLNTATLLSPREALSRTTDSPKRSDIDAWYFDEFPGEVPLTAFLGSATKTHHQNL